MNDRPLSYGDALASLRPSAAWVIEDNDLENIRWESEEPMPTKSEIEEELERLISERELAQAQKITAKDSALEKLALLGLTEEEARAVIGL
jgi:hypothetical protein